MNADSVNNKSRTKKAVSALLVVDVQRGLFDRPVPVFRESELLDNINALITSWRKDDQPVVFIQHANHKMLVRGSAGWTLHPDLNFREGDPRVEKNRGDAFRETGLANLLHSQGVQQVVVTGLVSQGCVRATCQGAVEHGFRVVLVKDGHSNYRRDAEEVIGRWNRELAELGVSVRSTGKMIENLPS